MKIKKVPFDERYEVSDCGIVFSSANKKRSVSEPWINSSGYPTVKVGRVNYPVHRLVAITFLGYPGGDFQVNHIDGNKENNAATNLEWVSQKENLYHAMDNGLHPMPRKPIIGTNVVTGDEIHFESQAEAGRNGFAQGNISKCISGERPTCKGYTWRFAE